MQTILQRIVLTAQGFYLTRVETTLRATIGSRISSMTQPLPPTKVA